MTIFDALPLLVFGLSIGLPLVGVMLRMEGRLKRIETIIERELTPNGGTSIRDRIVRIETQLHTLNLNTE